MTTNLMDKGLGEGWAWDDESYWYSAQSSAVSFNDNCVDLAVSVNKEKRTARVSVSPNTKYIVPVNEVKVVTK